MLILPRVDDFPLAAGPSAWDVAGWQTVPTTGGGPGHATRFRAVYSATGLYVGFDCDDARQITTGLPDEADLWVEDVVEAFFWPDERQPLYLEYELSPFGSELLLLVPNRSGEFMGWSPWHFEADRRTRKGVWGDGGTAWSAAFFLPFTLLRGVADVPAPGTIWRANFCRIDHDTGTPELYSWSPGITATFHDPQKFGMIEFGT
jgi:hypothetical protein